MVIETGWNSISCDYKLLFPMFIDLMLYATYIWNECVVVNMVVIELVGKKDVVG